MPVAAVPIDRHRPASPVGLQFLDDGERELLNRLLGTNEFALSQARIIHRILLHRLALSQNAAVAQVLPYEVYGQRHALFARQVRLEIAVNRVHLHGSYLAFQYRIGPFPRHNLIRRM